MIGLNKKVSDQEFLEIMQAVTTADNVEDLAKRCHHLTSYKYGIYHHIPAVGTPDYHQLNRYWSKGLDKESLDYLGRKGTKTDPVMAYIFSQSRPYWLSDLRKVDALADGQGKHRVELAMNHLGDGILSPLFGPLQKRGYIYLAFNQPREHYDEIFLWQIQAIFQAIHIRYCLLVESLRARVDLTKRESEVLELITFGKTNPEIGLILGISPNTVAGHVKRIFLKFNASDRVTVALKAQSSVFGQLNTSYMTENIHRDAV